jgi:putative transcriptional regulator
MKNKKLKVTNDNFADLLMKSAKQALDHSKGKLELRETVTFKIKDVPDIKTKDIAKIRKDLNVSQPVFAKILNVSSAAVKKWEQGEVLPSGATLRLLQIIIKNPKGFKEEYLEY